MTYYIYRGKTLDYIPIKFYVIDRVDIIGSNKYITIRKVIPLFVHIVIVLSMLVSLILINYYTNHIGSIQKRIHTVRLSNTFYYDKDTKVLDIDYINDSSNMETVSITLTDYKGNIVFDIRGIKPGESISSILVDNYTFNKLPSTYKLKYSSTYNNYIFKDTYFDIIVVDTSTTINNVNNNF